jgi:TctA family transporter
VENSGVAVHATPSSTVTAMEGWVFASTGQASAAGRRTFR